MLRWLLVAAAVVALSQGDARGQGSCLTTVPPSPSFVPPAPYWQNASVGSFWFGTEALWTGLPIGGKWGGLHNDKGFRQKLFFWSKGYDWRKDGSPELIITAVAGLMETLRTSRSPTQVLLSSQAKMPLRW